MFKKTLKLASLLLLLVFSFIYTEKVFSKARESDPVMKEVLKLKKENDIKPKEPTILDDELILGISGLTINEKESYKKMKENDKFDEDKIVYETKLPKNSISKTYEYYIKQGNPSLKKVSIIFKVKDNDNLDNLLSLIAKEDITASFFIDGVWLEENIETAFSINNLGLEIYNLGYNGTYLKNMITTTNNLIESITLKDSNYCLNDEKNDEQKNICLDRKMHTIMSTIKNPSLKELKENLKKGAIISYDVSSFDESKLGIIVNTITSRGYDITSLNNLLKE